MKNFLSPWTKPLLIGTAFFLGLVIGAYAARGYYLDTGRSPGEPIKIEHTDDIPKLKDPPPPETITVYQDVLVTDTLYIEVPIETRDYAIIGLNKYTNRPRGIDIRRGEVSLTYFNPSLQRYVRDTYNVPVPETSLSIFSYYQQGLSPLIYEIGVGIEVSHKRLSASADAGIQKIPGLPVEPLFRGRISLDIGRIDL